MCVTSSSAWTDAVMLVRRSFNDDTAHTHARLSCSVCLDVAVAQSMRGHFVLVTKSKFSSLRQFGKLPKRLACAHSPDLAANLKETELNKRKKEKRLMRIGKNDGWKGS